MPSKYSKSVACSLLLTAGSALNIAAQAEEPDLSMLQSALGGSAPDSVSEMPVPGLYEVVMGSQVLYVTEDGRYVIQGEVIDLETAQNLTETRQNTLRADKLAKLDESKMIVFAPEGEAKHTVTVFTDIDCGYCRKLHAEIGNYNEQGISVRYLAFPRAGLESESYRKAVSAWCSDDPNAAMTDAKAGQTLEEKTCDNPVGDHYSLGQQLGVRGTPSIFLDNGEMVPGYVPADRLAKMLADSEQTN